MKAFCNKSSEGNAGGRLFEVVGLFIVKLCCPVAVQASITVGCRFVKELGNVTNVILCADATAVKMLLKFDICSHH